MVAYAFPASIRDEAMTFVGNSGRSPQTVELPGSGPDARVGAWTALGAHLLGLAFAAMVILGLAAAVALALRSLV
jgi:hypothetical protein